MSSQGGLTLYLRSPNDLIFNYALSSAYKSSWVYDPSFSLSRDPDIWEIVRNDAVFKGCMNRCVRAVVRPWKVAPARQSRKKPDRLYADVCWEGLSHIDEFDAKRRRMADAIFTARTYSAIIAEKRKISLADTPEMEWWIPTQLQDIDRRRIHWVATWEPGPNGQQVKKTHLEMFDTNKWQWFDITAMRENMVEWVYENTEDRVGYGRGLLEAIYFYHYMKTVTFERISQGIDRWANGIWKVKLDSLRGSATDKANATLVNTAKTMLRNMRSDHVAVLGDGDDIEVVETSGTGHQAAMEFLHYLDDEVERLVNGSIRASGGASNQASGARAQSETEANTTEAYHQDDRDGLDAIFDRDLLGWFIRNNWLNIQKLGLDKAKRPKFTSEQVERQDPLVAVQVAQGLQMLGFPLAKQELAEKTDFSIAAEDEEVLEGPSQLQKMQLESRGNGNEKPDKPKDKAE